MVILLHWLFPRHLGTTHAQAIKAVGPSGKIFKMQRKRKEIYKMGYSPDLLHKTQVKDIYPKVETINIAVGVHNAYK